jgi:hypothetical protein
MPWGSQWQAYGSGSVCVPIVRVRTTGLAGASNETGRHGKEGRAALLAAASTRSCDAAMGASALAHTCSVVLRMA